MSRQSKSLAATVAALAGAAACTPACTIEEPRLTDGGGGLPAECSRYADQLVTYTPPDQEGGSGEGGERALGEPDGEGVPLDVDGVLIVSFIGAGGIEDGEDEDLTIHATGDEGGELTLYATGTEGDRAFTGIVTPNDRAIDLGTARVGRAVHIEFVGTAASMTVDAIEATRDPCVELTATAADRPQLGTVGGNP